MKHLIFFTLLVTVLFTQCTDDGALDLNSTEVNTQSELTQRNSTDCDPKFITNFFLIDEELDKRANCGQEPFECPDDKEVYLEERTVTIAEYCVGSNASNCEDCQSPPNLFTPDWLKEYIDAAQDFTGDQVLPCRDAHLTYNFSTTRSTVECGETTAILYSVVFTLEIRCCLYSLPDIEIDTAKISKGKIG